MSNRLRDVGKPSQHKQLSKLIAPFQKRYSKRIASDNYIFKENDTAQYVYLIINGMIKLTKRCLNQSELEVNAVSNGNFIGMEAIFPYGYYYCNAIAAKETIVCAIPKEDFLKVFYQYNSTSMLIMDEAYKEINDMEEKITAAEQMQSFQPFNSF